MKGFTQEQIVSVVQGAVQEAQQAARAFLQQHGDRDCCGFAWVNIYGVRSNSKEGKALQAAGFSKSYDGSLQLWNPSRAGVQSISVLEAGAEAFAKFFKAHFPEARIYAGSRMD